MKVEVRISAEIKEPYIVIYTNELTTEVNQIAALIDNATESIITVSDNERIVILRPDEIYMVRVENEKLIVYCKAKKYSCGKRLYELENLLGGNFMRISRSVLVNLRYLDCVEPSVGGMMLLVLKNGCKDYISRKYLPAFKKYLGL